MATSALGWMQVLVYTRIYNQRCLALAEINSSSNNNLLFVSRAA